MAIRRSIKKAPELKVVFDTNSLYNGSASDLLQKDVASLIKDNSNHIDLKISWYLPDTVLHERTYQMQKIGVNLLPSIQKLEKLLGHNLNINQKIIEDRISDTIQKQIQDYNLQIINLNVTEVNWHRLIMDAVYRRAPFEAGEKEKGFRDALIIESFLQLISNTPSTPKICRIAFITNDKLLVESLKSRTSDRLNVRTISSIEELKGLINTLVAEVSEEFVNQIQVLAKEYFFIPKELSTLYYKENIWENIESRFSEQLSILPAQAEKRQNTKTIVNYPQFIKKEGQKVFWSNRIVVESKAVRSEPARISSNFNSGTIGSDYFKYLSSDSSSVSTNINYQPFINSVMTPNNNISVGTNNWLFTNDGLSLRSQSTTSGQSFLATSQTEVVIATGRTIFEITWSVTVSTTKKLSNPRIESINYIETVWEQ